MDLNLHLSFDAPLGTWVVWNKTSNSEFKVTFDCNDAAISFMVKFISEWKL